MKTSHRILIAPLITAGAAAAIAVSPVASAAVSAVSHCAYSGPGNSVCASPGNAQIVAAPTDVPYPTWDGYRLGYGYGYGPLIVANGSHHFPGGGGGHR
jgi:hypothetical protein